MSLKNRKSYHGTHDKQKKQKNSKSIQPHYKIDLAKAGYFSIRLLASLIGYIMAIVAYITIYCVLTFIPSATEKLMDICTNNQRIFSFLLQPVMTRQSIIIPSDNKININCSMQTSNSLTFFIGISMICMACWCFHFGRRILEVLFIHKYHRTRPCKAIIEVSLYYTLLAIWVSISTSANVYSIYILQLSTYKMINSTLFPIKMGIIIFMFGEIGNFVHHYLLSKMREKPVKGHVIPYGGMFYFVSCPHYFFELLSWFGFILISCLSVGSIVIYVLSTLILARRAIVKHQKYIQEFGELYPKNRMAIIPFIL